jgi:hypothetical protein
VRPAVLPFAAPHAVPVRRGVRPFAARRGAPTFAVQHAAPVQHVELALAPREAPVLHPASGAAP